MSRLTSVKFVVIAGLCLACANTVQGQSQSNKNKKKSPPPPAKHNPPSATPTPPHPSGKFLAIPSAPAPAPAASAISPQPQLTNPFVNPWAGVMGSSNNSFTLSSGFGNLSLSGFGPASFGNAYNPYSWTGPGFNSVNYWGGQKGNLVYPYTIPYGMMPQYPYMSLNGNPYLYSNPMMMMFSPNLSPYGMVNPYGSMTPGYLNPYSNAGLMPTYPSLATQMQQLQLMQLQNSLPSAGPWLANAGQGGQLPMGGLGFSGNLSPLGNQPLGAAGGFGPLPMPQAP